MGKKDFVNPKYKASVTFWVTCSISEGPQAPIYRQHIILVDAPGIDGGQDSDVLLDDHAVTEGDETLLGHVQTTFTCGRLFIVSFSLVLVFSDKVLVN